MDVGWRCGADPGGKGGGRRTVSGWAEMKQRICLKVSPSWLSNLLYNLVSKSIEQEEKLLILD